MRLSTALGISLTTAAAASSITLAALCTKHARQCHETRQISSSDAPAAIGPYSQAIVTNGLVFASGQIALDPKEGKLVGDNVASQTVQVMKNVSAVLKACGSDLKHVVKSTVFLANMKDFDEFNKVYASYFEEKLPARSAVEVSALPKGALVEVEVIAKTGCKH